MSSPEAQTWAMGDRTIICLQESFGLSGTDPAKLDRLIKLERLKVGDCFNEAPETDGLLVERIDCSEAWELRVLDSFDVEGTGRYPGGSFFDQLTYGTCDKRSTTTRLPSGDTWALGDRTVICLQESFGLSATDPGKLDHLIGIDGLDVGDCFNEAAETEHVLVERVDCSGAWESRIVAIFTDPSNDDFPGDAYFQAQATLECGPSWDYYYPPSPESWSLGDRNVVCVRDS